MQRDLRKSSQRKQITQRSRTFSLLTFLLAGCFLAQPAPGQITPYYAAIWEGRGWNSYHGLNSSDYQARFSLELLQGYRLVDVSGYAVGGADYYAGIWEQNDGRAWQAFHGLNASDYQTRFNQYTSQGYRPVHVAGYGVNGTALYSGIWEENDGMP